VRIAPGGATRTFTEQLPGYPNGMVVVPDASALLVIEAKAERVAKVPVLSDGSAGEASTFARLPDTDADGLALDADGYLWATLYRPDGLVRLSPDGDEVLRIDDHLATTLEAPTNLTFIGERLDRAVVANVGGRHLLSIDLGVKGQPLHYPEVGS
jgi:sugar lactone lactonase YvrE